MCIRHTCHLNYVLGLVWFVWQSSSLSSFVMLLLNDEKQECESWRSGFIYSSLKCFWFNWFFFFQVKVRQSYIIEPFFSPKKLYTVECFTVWRQGELLHSGNQKFVFYNLPLEEAFIDSFMEDVSEHVWKTLLQLHYQMYLQLFGTGVRGAWLHPVTSVTSNISSSYTY